MRYLLLVLSVLVFISCGNTDKKQTPDAPKSPGKDASKELCEGCKKIYEEGKKSGDKNATIEKVVKFRESVEKKYAEQLKTPDFKKDYDDENVKCKQELEKILNEMWK